MEQVRYEEEVEEEIEEEEEVEQPKPIPTIRPRPKSTKEKPLIQNVENVETKYGGKKSRKSNHQSIFSPKESLTGWYMK